MGQSLTRTSTTFRRYLELEKGGGFVQWLLTFPGFRDRILMDPSFLTKIGIEMALGGEEDMFMSRTGSRSHAGAEGE